MAPVVSHRIALAAVVLSCAAGVQVQLLRDDDLLNGNMPPRVRERKLIGMGSARHHRSHSTSQPLCGLGQSDIPPFPALRVRGQPSYLMCLRPETEEAALTDDHRYGLGLLEHGESLSFAGDEHHCDWLPHLMSSRTDGVFVDVGMNVGACTMLMLSKGYKVYGFEPQRLYYQSSNFSVMANEGFAQRAHISNLALTAPPSLATLDSQLRDESRIHLMKIDIDGTELDVLRGAESLLATGKLEVVQIELNAEEQPDSTSDKLAILQKGLQVHGYKLYALVAKDTFEEFIEPGMPECSWQHATAAAGFSFASMQGHRNLADSWGRDAERYGFGDLRPRGFQLIEACTGFITRCFNQFVAIHPKSAANSLELVSNAVGSC